MIRYTLAQINSNNTSQIEEKPSTPTINENEDEEVDIEDISDEKIILKPNLNSVIENKWKSVDPSKDIKWGSKFK